MLLDTHYHFDFIQSLDERRKFLETIKAFGIDIVAQTVLPSRYQQLDNIIPNRLSLGFHPWWIQSQQQVEEELDLAKQLIATTRYIGEIGLDYSPRVIASAPIDLQKVVFESMINMVMKETQMKQKPIVLSIHAVQSVEDVLMILENYQVYQSTIIPILHGFSGTSDEVVRHSRQGGYFSFNQKMLSTKKGRAYCRQIPQTQLLLESDLPLMKSVKDGWEAANQLQLTLNQTYTQLSELIGKDFGDVLRLTQNQLYDL